MTREQLVLRVADLMGHSPFVAGDVEVAIEGSIERREGSYVAELRALGADGELLGARELVEASADCHALDASVALVVTLLIDEALPAHGASTPTARRELTWTLGAGALLQSGVLPRLAGGAGVLAGVRVGPRWSFLLSSAFFPPRSQRDALGRGTRARAWYIGLATCPTLHAWHDRGRLEACAAFDLGALHASPRGLADAADSARLWAQAKLELAWQWPLWQRLALRAAGGAAIAVARPSFRYASAEDASVVTDLHTVATASGTAQLSFIIELR